MEHRLGKEVPQNNCLPGSHKSCAIKVIGNNRKKTCSRAFGSVVLHMRGNWSPFEITAGLGDIIFYLNIKMKSLTSPVRMWGLTSGIMWPRRSAEMFIYMASKRGALTRDFDPWLCTDLPPCCLGDHSCFKYGQVLYDYFISYCKTFRETLYERQYKNKLNWTMASPPHFLVLKPLEQKVQCWDKGRS